MKTTRFVLIAILVLCRLSSFGQDHTRIHIPANSNDSLFIAIQSLPDSARHRLIKEFRYCVQIRSKTKEDSREFCDSIIRDFSFDDPNAAFDSVKILREIQIIFDDSLFERSRYLSEKEKGLIATLRARSATNGTKGVGYGDLFRVAVDFENDEYKCTVTSSPKDGARLYFIRFTDWDKDRELRYLDETQLTPQVIQKVRNKGYQIQEYNTTLQMTLCDCSYVLIANLNGKYKIVKPYSAYRTHLVNFKFD